MEYDFVYEKVDFETEDLAPDVPNGESKESFKAPTAESVSEPLESLNDPELPIVSHKQEILDFIESNQISVICGTTGSGKTTQIPQYLTRYGKVVCTQPRQLAAISVSQRVASEFSNQPHRVDVGYKVRFDDKSNANTKIKFVTDGILLREFLADRDLSEYDAIMIDEAHERTLHTDITLTLLKQVCKRRPGLKVVISSATLNTAKFRDFFDAPVYEVPGRLYPVDTFYTKSPEPDYLRAALLTIFQIHMRENDSDTLGDILVFLPGQDEIETLQEHLLDARNKLGDSIKELVVCPVYATLPAQQQQRIFEPTPKNCRKIILATNIAETSLTIPGVVYVIDPGFVKVKKFNPRSGMDSLTSVECSQASSKQRSGRAGRVQRGECYRLYPKSAFKELPLEPTPEILRTNLAGVVLLLLSFGVKNVLEFDFIDKPAPDALVQALQVLYSLGAVNKECKLTKTGRKMIELPVEPIMAKTILESHRLGCLNSVLIIIAMLGELGQVFYRPKKRKEEADTAHKVLQQPGGDHPTLLHVYNLWVASDYSPRWCFDNYVQHKVMLRVRNVVKQLRKLCQRLLADNEQTKDGLDAIRRAFCSGYVTNIAKISNNGAFYTSLSTSVPIFIHPSSSLAEETPKYVIYNEIVVTSREYMRGCLGCDEIKLA